MLYEAVKQGRTLEGVQYLRGVAALMVVVHHARGYFGVEAADWSTFGSRGVDVFFVISGFIMAFVTQRYQSDVSRWPQVRDFLVKRVIRVVPLYWLALAIAARYLIVNGQIDVDLLKDFAFIPRWLGDDRTQPFPYLIPGWTINYEMFFYLTFGVCMMLGRMRYVVLFGFFALLILAGMTQSSESVYWAFYTQFILSEFLLGILLFHLVSNTSRSFHPLVYLVALVGGTVGLVLANDVLQNHYLFGITSAILLWGALNLLQDRRNRFLLLVGDASYSIYIFHSVILEYGTRLLRKTGLSEPDPLTIVVVFASQILLVLVLSIFLHKMVEKPLVSLGQRLLLRKGASARATTQASTS